MVEGGRVRINGAAAIRLKQPVMATDNVEVSDAPANAGSKAEDVRLPFAIVFEDADVIVVDKPAGLLTSTVPGERRPTLLAAVREYIGYHRDLRARVGLIHRLDRDASGLLVFSRNDAAYRSLKTQFFHHTVVREYRAVVHGTPNPRAGRIETRLVERADGTVRSTHDATRGERAVSEYEVLKTERKLSLLRVTLQTGRKHQIRVQLAGRGTPVVGDTVYGPEDTRAPRLMLTATRLGIEHPRTGRQMEFTLPVPEAFPIRE
jgi:23S rRNA pseudouridine1911/1915/1917 synthase